MKESTIKILSLVIMLLFFGSYVIPSMASRDIDTTFLQNISNSTSTSIDTDMEIIENTPWRATGSLNKALDDTQAVLIRDISQHDRTILLQYNLPEPEFEEVSTQQYNNEYHQRISIGNALLSVDVGKPEIPIIPSRLILPRGQRIETVNIIVDNSVILSEPYRLSYAEQPQPITCTDNEFSATVADSFIYESNEAYPFSFYEIYDTQYGMGIAIAHIDIYPVIYKPRSGSLEYFQTFTLQIDLASDDDFGTDVRVDIQRFQEKIAPSLENHNALQTYIDGEIAKPYQNVIDSSASYSYVFITSNAVANDNSMNPSVNDFILHRQINGLTATVVTTEFIYSNYEGTTYFDKIRNFIKDAYNNWDTQFVTLGGDTNIIPLKTVYATQGFYSDDIPTDLPYQCLDGDTWDNDFFAEVMIGRISGQTATQISNQLHKIISYETNQDSIEYFQTGLSVGEELDDQTYGKPAMQELETYFSDDWQWEGLFDLDETWYKPAIINHINSNNFSIINHLGHSNFFYVMKMYNSDENSFTNTNYIFLKSQGCHAGAFDQNCITERFTTRRKVGGFFAAVMNSRYGWYSPGNLLGGPSHQLHRSFWHAAWNLNMDYFSEFNEYSHRMHHILFRWDVLQSNYFGCAATLFIGKVAPGDPPSVTVTHPVGGEVFSYGENQQITWSATAGDDSVKYITLLYSVDSGETWEIIEAGIPNTRRYSWIVPNEHSDTCLVQVHAVDILGRVGQDTSNNVFTIVGVPPTPPKNLFVDYISAPSQVVFDDFSEGALDNWTIHSGDWDATNNYLQGHGSISTVAKVNGQSVNAYGRWEFDFNLQRTGSFDGQAQNMRIHFIQTNTADSIQINNSDTTFSSGYYITINSYSFVWITYGFITIHRFDSGTTPDSLITGMVWKPNINNNTISVERTPEGVFSLYLNDELLGRGFDSTYTTNEYLGFRHCPNLGSEGDHIIHEIRVEVEGYDNDHNLISWDASPDETIGEVDYYNIYRSKYQNGPWDERTKINNVTADGSNSYDYIDFGKGMADDIAWWYVVRAVGTNGLEEINIKAVQEL